MDGTALTHPVIYPSQATTLRAVGQDEIWLQKWLAEDPSRLGIGKVVHPTISMNEYYDLFVDVMLGVGIIFEIPILLFLLTLIRVASPRFLVQHSRYAILIIVILAAIITPTGDVFNLALFATPMIILFYVGIFASYILVLKRENRRFPWGTFFKVLTIVIVSLIVISWLAARYYGYHIELRWPFLVK